MSDRDLRAPVRGQSVGDKQMQRGSFPFDAWEMDNARTNPSPVLELKSPWTLKLSGLTTSNLSVSGDLSVSGGMAVSGNATITGNLYFGGDLSGTNLAFHDFPSLATLSDDDELVLYDTSAGVYRKVNKSDLGGSTDQFSTIEAANSEVPDITLENGATLSEPVLYCNNLNISGAVAIQSRVIVCEGDLTIDSGAVLTVALSTSIYSSQGLETFPGYVNKPGYGGNAGVAVNGSGSPGHGGFASAGGSGTPVASGSGGVPAITGLDLGGDGGAGGGIEYVCTDASNVRNQGGGGGGGIGGGGGTGVGAGGRGGLAILILVKGNFLNSGTINADGAAGSASTQGGGGGGGGAIIVMAYGSAPSWGTLNARGGAGASGSTAGMGGGGGGGGHLELYGMDFTTPPTYSVAGGAAGIGGTSGNAGAIGTYIEVDWSDTANYARNMLGGKYGDIDAGWVLDIFAKPLF